jgi:hypothetical protein
MTPVLFALALLGVLGAAGAMLACGLYIRRALRELGQLDRPRAVELRIETWRSLFRLMAWGAVAALYAVILIGPQLPDPAAFYTPVGVIGGVNALGAIVTGIGWWRAIQQIDD